MYITVCENWLLLRAMPCHVQRSFVYYHYFFRRFRKTDQTQNYPATFRNYVSIMNHFAVKWPRWPEDHTGLAHRLFLSLRFLGVNIRIVNDLFLSRTIVNWNIIIFYALSVAQRARREWFRFSKAEKKNRSLGWTSPFQLRSTRLGSKFIKFATQ